MYAWIEGRTIGKNLEINGNSLSADYVIRAEVLNYDYDDRFIIAYQVYSSRTRFYYDSKSNYSDEDTLLVQLVERNGKVVEIPQNDSLVAQYRKIKEIKNCYWIIDKETDQVMGPMRKEEFDCRCKALNVKAKMHKFFEQRSWDERRKHLQYP